MKIKLVSLVALSCILVSTSNAQEWTELQKILPLNSPVNDVDWYGFSIAAENNVIVVGAPFHDNVRGCAYVLQKNAGGWETIATLTAQSSSEEDGFGINVAISGNTVVVGSFGKAYIFNKPETGWQNMIESETIEASNTTNNNFGSSVAISENILVVGACSDEEEIGKIYIYENISNSWTKKATLSSSDGTNSDRFGEKIRVSGNTVVTGASLSSYSGPYPGSAYVFEKPATGWEDMTQTAKLTSSDGPNENSSLGSSVSIYNNTILVGAEYTTRYGKVIGSAYLYEKPLTGWTDMTETAILNPSESTPMEEEQFFGSSVTLCDTMAIVGAHWDGRNGDYSGSAYVFSKPQSGWESMTETEILLPEDGSIRDEFGISVALVNNYIFVGATGAGIESDEITDAGALYIFKSNNIQTKLFSKESKKEISLYPNPTRDQLVINTTSEILNCRLYSISGKLLLEKNNISNVQIMDLSPFDMGCYLLTIQTSERVICERIFKY